MPNLLNPLHPPSKHELSQQLSFSKQSKRSTRELTVSNVETATVAVDGVIAGEEAEEAAEETNAGATTIVEVAVEETDEAAKDQNRRMTLTNTAKGMAIEDTIQTNV